MVALTQSIPNRGKFPRDKWVFDYHPRKGRWETYRIPQDWPPGLYKWLFDTFGLNLGMDSASDWDYHGGWIYLYKEEYVLLFTLRWS
jgi:hypothetical protein